MLGTYLLVLIGPSSVVFASTLPGVSPLGGLFFVALVFGSTVGLVIAFLGRYSGAHINPAITVAMTLSGTFKNELFLPYVLFQVIGGVVAGVSLKLAFGGLAYSSELGATRLSFGIDPIQGLALEIAGTFILALSALFSSSFLGNPVKQASLVGTTLFILIILIGPFTGASFNPARSLGPALFSGYFTNQLVYWFGPVIGAACAGLLFAVVRRNHVRRSRIDTVCKC